MPFVCLRQRLWRWSWWFHQDVKGGSTDRAVTVFVWCPALVVYGFHGHLLGFFYPHPFTVKFSLKTFLALNFSLVSAWLHWWASFHLCLVAVVTALLPLSGTPWAAFGELLLENLTVDLSSEHRTSWSVNPLQKVCWLCLTRVQCLETYLAG